MRKNNHPHPLHHYIWLMVMGILVFFLLAITLTNTLLLRQDKREFYYTQLADSAQSRRSFERDRDLDTLVNHYLLILADPSAPTIAADNRTKSHYLNDEEGIDILQGINQEIIKQWPSQEDHLKGYIDQGQKRYYFYADLTLHEDELLVYVAETSIDPLIHKGLLLPFFLTLILSFFITRALTRHLLSPLDGIKAYTQAIGRQEWQSSPPPSHTREFHELAQSLYGMSRLLETAQQREQQFLQSSSHNLKTPVMVIKGYAQALLDGVPIEGIDSPPTIIRQEAQILEHRISQLLKLSTFGHAMNQTKDYEAIRIDRLIKAQVRHFSVIKSDIEWTLDLFPLEIQAHGEALLNAIENLLENQIRYARQQILVKMTTTQLHERAAIEIRIYNDGPNFSQANPQVLFDRYQKDDHGHWGLGLAIVKQVVEGHHGQIRAFNEADGVSFQLILPIF